MELGGHGALGWSFGHFLLCISAGLGNAALSLAFCFVLPALFYSDSFGSTFFCSFCFVPALLRALALLRLRWFGETHTLYACCILHKARG